MKMRCVRRYMFADDTRETSNAANNDIVPKLSFSSPSTRLMPA